MWPNHESNDEWKEVPSVYLYPGIIYLCEDNSKKVAQIETILSRVYLAQG